MCRDKNLLTLSSMESLQWRRNLFYQLTYSRLYSQCLFFCRDYCSQALSLLFHVKVVYPIFSPFIIYYYHYKKTCAYRALFVCHHKNKSRGVKTGDRGDLEAFHLNSDTPFVGNVEGLHLVGISVLLQCMQGYSL